MAYKTRSEAKKAALRVLGRYFRGKGAGPWRHRTWNNLGWHWSIYLGPINVYESGDGSFRFFCLIADTFPEDGVSSTHGSGYWHNGNPAYTHADTPMEAVKLAVGNVRDFLKGIRKLGDRLERVFETIGV